MNFNTLVKLVSGLLFLTLFSTRLSAQCNNDPDPCQGATYTQGRWGASNCNASSQLNNSFSSVFPNGITIGCSGSVLKLTTVTAVKAFLPSGSTPTSLPTGTLSNPGSSYQNVLAGQLVALTLNMYYDMYDPNFSPSSITLNNYTITSGTFAGMRVDNFLSLANSIIGGCSSQYSYSQLNVAATKINENYHEGEDDDGFLRCGGPCSLTVNSSYNPIVCKGGTTTVTITASSGMSPYTGTGVYTVSAGTYTFNVTDAYGCTAKKVITFSQPNSALVVSTSAGSISCFGGSTNVTVTASGGTSPYSNTGVFSKPAGSYNFTVSDSKGCSVVKSITITQPAQLVVNSSSGSNSCLGGNANVTVTASGGTAPYTGTGVFSKPAGVYTFTVTDSKACTATTTHTVTQPSSNLSANASFSAISCFGGLTNVVVTASGGTAPYTGTGTFVKGAGQYVFTVTDALGCSTVASVSISQPTQLSVTAANSIISCFGGNTNVTVTASGGTAPYSGTGVFSKPAGTYTFSVTDAKGCSKTTTLTITQPAAPLTASIVAGPLFVFGANTTLTVSASGGTAPYTGTGIFTVTAGTYTYLVTDANGCTTSVSVTITQPDKLVATATAGSILCYGGITTVTVTATGGASPNTTGPLPYTGTGTFTAAAGTHTYLVTDGVGTAAVASVNITQPPLLIVNIAAGTISGFGGTTTVTITANGGTAPYTGTGTFTAAAGTHTYLVTDANGCTKTLSVTISQPAKLVATATAGSFQCSGNVTTVTVSATGGVGPYTGTGTFTATSGTHTYLVSDANGNTAVASVTISQPIALLVNVTAGTISGFGGSTTVTVSALGGVTPITGTGVFTVTAGTHTFLVTDARGCSKTATITIGQPAQLIASATAGSFQCNNNVTTVTVSATGGVGPYTGTGTFTAAAGSHTYLVTDANGNTAVASVTISQPIALLVNVTAGTISGFGGSTTVTVSALGGVTPITGTGVFTVTAGTHTFLVTDSRGCSKTATITIGQPAQLVATATAGSFQCSGNVTTVTVSATGGVGLYTGTGTFTATPGTHTYLVSDANGNTAVASVTISQPIALLVNVTAGTISGFGGSTTVTVSALGGVTPITGTGVYTVTAGTHTFLVTDARGCSKTATITIGQPAQLVANAVAGTILCNGGLTTVTVSASGGVAPYTGTGTFTASAGTHTYLVTDANGNTAIASVNISQPSVLVANVSAGTISGFGGNTTVTVTANGGTAPYTGTGIFTVTAGTYTYLVTDANDCSTTVSVSIAQPAQLVASAVAGTILCNGGITTVTVTANGGVAPYTGTGTFTASAGTHTYLVTDANGNTAIASVNISQPTLLTANVSAGTISGFGGNTTVTVTANGGTAPYNGTGVFTVTAGTFTYLVTDANDCSTTVSITITQPGQLVANAVAGTILCNGGLTTVTVNASGGVAPYTGTGNFTAAAGTHTYLVTDANGNTAIASVNISQPTLLTANVSAGTISGFGGNTTVTVTANGGTGPYTGTGVFTVTAGTYTYLVTDANGCSATVSVSITQPGQLVANAVAGTILCNGGLTTVTVSATGGVAPYTGTGTFTAAAGTHTYLVTDANGNTAIASVNISQPSVLVANASAGSISGFGGNTTVTVTANGGTAPYNGTGVFTVTAGTYTYLVTDANDCSTTVSVSVAQPGQLVANALAGTILCNGGITTVTVSASGGVAPYTGTGNFTAAAGTHTYLVTDANGNTAIASVNISQPSVLVANISAGTISGFGGNTTVTVTANGGTAPYTGTGVFTVTAGNHTYLVTDANGCSTTVSVTVAQPGQLVANAVAGTILCNGGLTTVTVSATGGVAPYTGTGTFTATAGTHTYLVTDANGNTAIASVNISQPSVLVANVSAGTISGFGGNTTVTVTANGGTAPYTGTGVFTVTAGTYTYLVTDANGCSTTVSITVTQPGQLVANAVAGTILCNGGITTVTVSATGGVAPYTGTGTFSAAAGSHTYLVTDANGNTAIASVNISQPTLLTANVSAGTISGFGGNTTVTVTANGGTAPYTGTGVFTVTAGTYTYLVTDANDCSTTVSITVTQPGQLVANAVAGTILCNAGLTTVTVSASGGVAPYTGTGTFSSAAGSHTYLVTDANGNTAIASVNISQPSVLVANISAGTISGFGGSTTVTVTANGGTAPYTGTGIFTVTAGTYTYLVTDANGCSTTVSITVTQPGQLVANAVAGTILCNGGITTVTVSANGGVAPYTGTGTFTATAGSHTYLITDANGNTAIASVNISQPSVLVANISAGTISGFGGNTTVTVTANGGTAPYTGTGVFTVTAGNHTYLVTDANGCSTTVSVTVAQPGQLVANAVAGTILCNGGITTVTVSATGGVAPYTGTGTFTATAGTHTYLVTDANGNTAVTSVNISQPTQVIANATTGSILCHGGTTTVTVTANGGTAPYSGTGVFTVSAGTYTYLVTDANGCAATVVTVTITEPTLLTANVFAGTISGFGGNTTVTVTANGGTAPYTGTGVFTVTAGTYTYLVTDVNGCSTTVSVTVAQPGQLVANAVAGTILCNGGITTVTVSATGGVAPYTGTGTFTASAGTHTYLVTDANGNTAIASVNISQPTQVIASATTGSILCHGGSTTVTISANGGTAPYSGTGIFTVSAGTYTYLVTDANGCAATVVTVNITEPSLLTANVSAGTISGFGGNTTVTVTANGGTAPYTGTGFFTVTAGTYTYLVTDVNGCSTTVSITVTQPGQLVANAVAGTILCNGGITTVTVSANGGVAPYTGTGTFTATAGSHTYLVTDANGNTAIASVNISQPSVLVANVSAGTISGFGGSTTVTVTANGGTAPYTGTGVFTVTAGTYTYLVTDVNGCSTTVTLTVAQPGQLVANAVAGTILCNGGITTVTVSATGGVAPYTGTGTFSASVGSHTYLVTDANGNTAIASVNISQPSSLVANVSAGTISGFGGNTTVTVTANGGTAPYTGTGVFTVTAGTYTYLVTDANDCSTTVSVTVAQPGQLVANALAGTILCNGGITTVTVSANGGVAPYTGTGTFTATAGTHTYLVTDANGNTAIASVNISQPTQLTANVSAGTISGFGGNTTVTVTANGGTAPYTGTGVFTVTAGTYTYLVTDANGCSTTVSITVTQPGQLVANAVAGTILCNGGITTVTVSATGGVAPYTGTGTFTATAGTHTYLVTDANGNTAIASVNISQPTQVIASAATGSILCHGGTTTLTISANGGTAPYSGTGVFTVSAGTYTYLVTDANGCAATVVTVNITEPTLLTANVSAGTISGFGGNTTVAVTANGGTAPYTGTGVFTVTAGTYTYLVTDANGCSTTVSVSITQPGQLVANAIAGTILCNGGITTVTVSASGGVAPYTGTGTFTATAGTHTYLVTDANGNTAIASVNISQPSVLVANISAGTISGFGGNTTVTVTANGGTAPYTGTGIFTVTAGTYTYLVTDANDCSTTVSVTVAQPGQLVANAVAGTILCNGGLTTVTVSANGGVAPYTGTGTFTATAGTHTYLVTDANGNTAIASVNISQPTQVIASATNGSILCHGGTTTVTISANGGTAPYSGTGIFTVSAGTYTYLVTDANGCAATVVTVNITEPSLLTANVSAGTISGFGGNTTVTVTANGGTAPYTGTGFFTVTAGTYTYLVTDANGCSTTVSITVTQPGQLVANAVAGTILCNGGITTVTVSATGGVAPYTGTGTFTAAAGTHTYLVTDANGNTAIASVNISQPTQVIANATTGSILCHGGTTTVTISANGGTAPYSGTGIFTVSAGTYTYLVTDANGCAATVVTVTITEPSLLTANVSAGTISGFGGSTTVTVTANGGTAPYTGTGVFTVTAGTYTYLVTDANGCSTTVSITVTQPGQLVANAVAGTILCNGGITTVTVSATGGVAPYTGTGTFTASAGSHTYLVTDANGNTAIASVNISQPSLLVANISAGTISGFGGSTTVTVSANGGTAPYSGTGVFTVTAGTYTYLVTDANDCSTTVSITITQPGQLVANAVAGTILCNGGLTTVTVSATGGVAPYTGTGTFTAAAGTHTYLVTDANGNTAVTSVNISQPSLLTANVSAGTISGFGGNTTVTVTANGGTAPYTGTGVFTVTAGTYTYLVTDVNGCSTTVSVTVTQPGQLVANAVAGTILCNGGITTVTVSATGGVAPYTGTGTFTASAGTHTYLVTDANGNTAIASVNISQPSVLVANISAGTISGFGGNTTVTVTANGGTAPYTGTGVFTVTAGTYTYLVTDANGCSTTVTVTVAQPGQLVANAVAGTILCNGGITTVTVSANGGVAPYTGTGTFTATAGTHTYLVTDANGNTAVASVNISQPTQVIASAATGSILCHGGTTTVTISANGGTAPYSGTGIFTVSAGTYTYLVTDANGCAATVVTVTITEPSLLTANVSAGTISGFGGNTTVTVTANGGTAPYTGTGVFTVTAGTYTYLVTDANGCSTTVTVTVAQPGQLVANAVAGTILCNGGITTVTVSATGGVAPYTGTGTFTATAGTHTYLVTDANGNTAVASVNISQPTQVIASAATGSILCHGGTTTVTISANGGTAPYSGTGIFTVSAGTYTYLITDANGCAATVVTVTITEPSLLTANVSAGTISGFGGNTTVTVTANGGTAPYTGTGVFTVTAGTYTYLVTDANGCSATVSVSITQPGQLFANAVAGTILCNGGLTTVTVSATGGVAPYTGTGTFTAIAGTHTYLVTDANGNTAIASVNISQPSLLVANASSGTISGFGGNTTVTVTANGGTAPYTGTGVFTVTAGTYTYLVTDANGCSTTVSITLGQPAQLLANASAGNILCNVGITTVTVSASGGVAPYTGTGTFTATAGTHTYLVTDANGNTAITSINISQPSLLVANVSAGTISGFGGNTTVTVTANGGTAPYTGTGIFTVTAGTYNYLVSDANGCSTGVSINVTQPAQLLANALSSTILCHGGIASVTVTAVGGIAPYTGTGTFTAAAGTHTYLVTDSNGNTALASITINEPSAFLSSSTAGNILCFGASTSVTITAAGGTSPYSGTGITSAFAGTNTYTIVDANGCVSTTSVIITQPSQLLVNATSGTISCHGGSTSVSLVASGGTAPYTGTGVFVTTAGSTNYLVTDANGCSTSTTISVAEPSALNVTAAALGSVLCFGDQVNVSVSASGGTAPYSGTGIVSVSAGTHTYAVTDNNGCSANTSITISQPAAVSVLTTTSAIACFGDVATVTITAVGGSGSYSGDVGILTLGAGNHDLTIFDSNGCSTSTMISLVEPEAIAATISGNNILCFGGLTTVTITASGGTLPYTGTGLYTVSAGYNAYSITDANGCSTTTDITIFEPSALASSSSVLSNILCNGGTGLVDVSASGGTLPYNGIGTYTEAVGSYTHVVVDANGCTSESYVTLTEPTPVVATAVNGACNGSVVPVTVTGSGGTAPYTGETTYYVVPGNYTFQVIDVNGCTGDVAVLADTAGCWTSSGFAPRLAGSSNPVVYPNPNNGEFTVAFGDYTGTARLLNQSGQIVREFTIENNTDIRIEQLARGVYYIVTTEHQIKVVVMSE